MATTIKMPQLGESVTEGTIERWLVKEGDTVEQYDPLFEVVTDKVNAEVPAEIGGTIAKILVPEGSDGVKVGTAIALLAGEGEDVTAQPSPPSGGEGQRSEATPGEGADKAPDTGGGETPKSPATPATPPSPSAAAAASPSPPEGGEGKTCSARAHFNSGKRAGQCLSGPTSIRS